MEAKDLIQAEMDAQGLTVESGFVPWSQSRNKHEKHRSLNWRITLKRHGQDVLTTDYSAGEGYCPSYKQGRRNVDQATAIAFECEKGHEARRFGYGGPIRPDPVDVVWSLASDARVLDYPTYEVWADDTGYDPDSRKGERIYRECLANALKLRAALGDGGLVKLIKAGEDY
jgi:hypothetical protein